MRKKIIGFLLFSLGYLTLSFAQVDSTGLKEAMQKLDRALVQKDEPVLQKLLHKDVCYGHSSGWIQTKTDVFNDFSTGKLTYNKIETSNTKILTINKQRATVKMDMNAEGIVNGNSFSLSMYVMQVWLKTSKGWQLLARQSGKK